jgi:hypothetical protein
MADNTLEAFQLGASLYDRAQTQKRMMDQLQLQTAQQLMQQKSAAIQDDIHKINLGNALKEQEAGASDVKNMMDNMNLRDEFIRNPQSEYPRFLPVTSRANQTTMSQISAQLDNWAPRARLQKSTEKLEARQLGDAYDIQEQFGVNTIDKNGALNQEVIDTWMPKLLEQRKLKEYSQDVRAAFTQTDKSLTYDERVGKAIALARERGKSPSERNQERNAELAVSEYTSGFGQPDEQTAAFIKNNAFTGKWTPPVGNDQKRIKGDELIANSASVLAGQLDDFEKRWGDGSMQKYVGLIDGKIEELRRKISSSKTEEEKQAYALLQRFQSNFNAVAFEKSGKAVTSQEMERLKASLGNIQSNNFANDVRNFASLSAEDLHNTIDSFKDQYRISPSQIKLSNGLISKYKLGLVPFGQQSPATPSVGQPAGGGGAKVGRFNVEIE